MFYDEYTECPYIVFLRLVCPVLPVSLDCPFFIAPSVFSNIYLLTSSRKSTLMEGSFNKA